MVDTKCQKSSAVRLELRLFSSTTESYVPGTWYQVALMQQSRAWAAAIPNIVRQILLPAHNIQLIVPFLVI